MIDNIYEIVEEACKSPDNYFGYGIWKHHILRVITYGKLMSQKHGADEEVVELAALLHDYASVKDYSLYENHHIHSSEEAEKILQKFNYSEAVIEKVKEAIFSHRGSIASERKSKEALCLADADAMAHFDSASSLFYLAFFSHKMDVDEANEWLMGKLERSWHKLSLEAQAIMGDKYHAAMLFLKEGRYN